MKVFDLVLLFLTSMSAVSAAPAGTPADKGLKKRNYNASANASQVVDGTACRAVTVIYARGSEEEGNIGGAGELGPVFMNNLSALVGQDNLAVQGVDYNASLVNFADEATGGGGDAGGSQAMANLTMDVMARCPSTKLVLAGYSQGAYVVHGAARRLPPEAIDFVAAVQTFGDPEDDEAIGAFPSSKVNIDCHWFDGVCWGIGLVTPAHLDYQEDAPEAAKWVVSTIGM